MRPRFFAPRARAGQAEWLPDEEGRHLTRVLRLGPGALVGVFDGEGGEYIARVEAVAHGRASVRPVSRVEAIAEPAVKLTLAQAVLKADTMNAVVRDAVMLGAAAIRPLVTGRTTVSQAVLRRRGSTTRWARVAVSSAKQCGRAVVPEIASPVTFEAFVLEPGPDCRLILVEPAVEVHGRRSLQALRQAAASPAAATVVIGPEGGWTDGEVAEATAHGFTPITLGCRTLRAESAPSVVLSVLQFCWDAL